ncbi:MAG: phospholipase, partial [Rothia mucilaginosa]
LESDQRAIEQESDYVLEWVRANREPYASVTLLGFSQGMGIATSMVRHAPGELAAVLGLSGYAVDSDSPYFKDEELKKTELPVFFGRDQEDPVIPQEMVNYTYDWIRKYTDGIKVLYAGAGHGVSAMEIRHVGEFLEVKVQGKEPRIRAQKVAEATGTVEGSDA